MIETRRSACATSGEGGAVFCREIVEGTIRDAAFVAYQAPAVFPVNGVEFTFVPAEECPSTSIHRGFKRT